jgi:hypothetical protein
MIQNLFPSQIWKCSLNVEHSIRNNILNSIEENFQQNQSYLHPFWNCNVHTSFLKKDDIDYSSILPYFKDQYEKFSKQLNLNYHTYNIFQTWYNYYLLGYNQEYHDHIGKHSELYSAIYFLKIDEDHPKITFYNYTNYHVLYSSNSKLKNIYCTNDINHSITSMHYNLDVKEDDFIIFPSYLPHGVFVQKTNTPRITISLNIKVE